MTIMTDPVEAEPYLYNWSTTPWYERLNNILFKRNRDLRKVAENTYFETYGEKFDVEKTRKKLYRN